MNRPRIFVTSLGIIGPLGRGVDETLSAIRRADCAIRPLRLFPTSQPPLPVAEISNVPVSPALPRTHILALMAAEEALQCSPEPPDAVIIGTTTGGMTMTEERLLADDKDPSSYRCHSTASIAEGIARRWGCRGPVITVSTACSSGSVALKLACELLRSGRARRVLAGGADALCRLTYYGFHSLQLVDPAGAHPFDGMRRGMTVGEGAAMLLLTAAEKAPAGVLAELCGGGLSCDAYHPAAPHPEGEGALEAMAAALTDAGLTASDIDYIHLHGTGTADNDLSEAKAVHALFDGRPLPPVSSLKGAYGHALAAAGAMGAAVSALCLRHGVLPANTGFREPDPRTNLVPMDKPQAAIVHYVLCNAFGFGGNNAALILGRTETDKGSSHREITETPPAFFVHGRSCLTGAGGTEETLAHLFRGGAVPGRVSPEAVLGPLEEKAVRRLKRLPRMVLSLAASACQDSERSSPRAVFFGTGWGGLSETYDFLKKLFDTSGRFASPTDFIGSVHNAPAGQAAIHFQATGPNITTTGGDDSFEQALFCAELLGMKEPFLLIGADEYHTTLSPLFAPSVTVDAAADGGGALYLSPEPSGAACRIAPVYMAFTDGDASLIPDLVSCLGGAERIRERFGLILAGIPASRHEAGAAQLQAFLSLTDFSRPVVEYRRYLGEFATASAVATVLAVRCVEEGMLPEAFCDTDHASLAGRGVLVLGFGIQVTALAAIPC